MPPRHARREICSSRGAALAWVLTSPELDGRTDCYFDFRRCELTRWFGVDRTDWSEELSTGSLALCGIEHDPLRGTAIATRDDRSARVRSRVAM